MTTLFVYIVRYDCGFAPNPFYAYCTLATCKPKIRGRAVVGDWLLGLGSKAGDHADKVIYIMQVNEVLSYDQYWSDSRFKAKRPTYAGTRKQAFGDNIYHTGPQGQWAQLNSHHSHCDETPNLEHVERDTSADAVLISHTFSYFGGSAPQLPTGLDLVPASRRGYTTHTDTATLERLVAWHASIEHGFIGRPSDWD